MPCNCTLDIQIKSPRNIYVYVIVYLKINILWESDLKKSDLKKKNWYICRYKSLLVFESNFFWRNIYIFFVIFHYSKKSGKTGRHYPNQPILSKIPNSPILNSHHHTVMAGGITFPDNNGPYVRTAVQTTTTNNFG